MCIQSSSYDCDGRDGDHVPTEFKEIIRSYPYITQDMMDSHCEIMWADNYGSYLGRHPTSNYASGINDSVKQAIINQQRLKSKMIGLWIKNSLATFSKRKLRDFKSEYIFNTQYDGYAMFFVIVKMVRPDTRAGC